MHQIKPAQGSPSVILGLPWPAPHPAALQRKPQCSTPRPLCPTLVLVPATPPRQLQCGMPRHSTIPFLLQIQLSCQGEPMPTPAPAICYGSPSMVHPRTLSACICSSTLPRRSQHGAPRDLWLMPAPTSAALSRQPQHSTPRTLPPQSAPSPVCLPKPPGRCSLHRKHFYTRPLLPDQKR